MIDLVFVVDDPVSWHRENLKMNRHHYSALGWLGPKFISAVQENMASGVFYNPFVEVEDKLIKYGVISTQALFDDLTKWKSFYIAGRLQKPVRNLQSPVKSLIPCIEKNRLAALSFSLIHLPETTSTVDLYVTIAKLSYMGDFRMHVGENPRKAVNIVLPLIKEFDKIYLPLLGKMRPTVLLDDDGRIVQETNAKAVFQHMMKLPHSVQCSLVNKVGRAPKYYCVEDTMADLCQATDLKKMLEKEIRDIVFLSSIRQTIQGIFSAGIIKSIRYGFEKLKKKFEASGKELA